MALETIAPVTAWGSVHAHMGEVGSNGTMGSSLDDLGSIDENALTIETQDGTKLELIDINGDLIDELNKQPKLTIKFTLLKPSETVRSKFWDVEEIGAGDSRKVRVKSLVKNTKYSFMFANTEAVGSETFEAPVVSISMKPIYEASKGWKAECSLTLIKGQAGYFFDFGKVTAVNPLVVTPATLSFTSSADTTGKTITATSTNNIVATNNGSYWLQVTYANKVATVKVTANPNTEARDFPIGEFIRVQDEVGNIIINEKQVQGFNRGQLNSKLYL